MDKKEENILDDILSEDAEIEMPVIPETLRGDLPQTAESETIEEPIESEAEAEAEIEELAEPINEDTDEPTEITETSEKPEITEITEPEKPETTEKKSKLNIKSIVIICAAAVVIVVGGLFMFWKIDQNSNGYIMHIDGEKITMDEFKLTLMLNAMTGQSSEDEKQLAIDSLIHYSILEKMVKEKDAALSDEETEYLKTYVENIKNMFKEDNIKLSVSDERFEFLVNYMMFGAVQYILLDAIAAERNFTADETQIKAEIDNYKQNDKLVKYIITETEETAKEAQEAVNSGQKTPDEAVIQYCVDYNESYGVVKIDASQIGFPEDEMSAVMALKALEASDPVDLGGAYAVFIAATDSETEEWVKESYIFNEKLSLYNEEYVMYESDTKIKINDKAFNNFDIDKFWEELSPE
jgi:hypothetical protein